MSDHDPRVLQHVDAIASAGQDFHAFVAALDALRSDLSIPAAAKRAILKTIAQDQAIQYVAAVTGKTPRRFAPELERPS
jgi:hypothetical protein